MASIDYEKTVVKLISLIFWSNTTHAFNRPRALYWMFDGSIAQKDPGRRFGWSNWWRYLETALWEDYQ